VSDLPDVPTMAKGGLPQLSSLFGGRLTPPAPAADCRSANAVLQRGTAVARTGRTMPSLVRAAKLVDQAYGDFLRKK